MKHIKIILFSLLLALPTLFTSCIEPPLKLPAQEVVVDFPAIITDIEVVWNIDVDWKHRWYYGWDDLDSTLWGPIAYPIPTNYEVRRYYLGEDPDGPHTSVDGFTVYGNRFRRVYQFGYYDMLLWSNIDSEDGTQVVKIDESDPEEAFASTTVTRGMTRFNTEVSSETDNSSINGLFNQPEIFYGAYPRNIYISRNMEDYDYYDEDEHCWVKRINCELDPRVYIYLVQVILLNNDGRVVGTSGNAAMSAFSSGTSVNTGHTFDSPAMVYFNTRYKSNMLYETQTAEIIGGKLTTYGLCDMDAYSLAPDHIYSGSRTDLHNYLMVDFLFRNGAEKTMQFDVTKQCREQAHGGIITVILDCGDLEIPEKPSEGGTGSLFVPTVEDYDEIVYEIPL